MLKGKMRMTLKRFTALGLSAIVAATNIMDLTCVALASEVDDYVPSPQADMYDDVYIREMDYLNEYIDPEMYGQADIPLLRDGWYTNDAGKWNYYIKDVKQYGWVAVDGLWYNMDDAGDMRTGWFKPDKDKNIWYYLSSSGDMQKGWIHLADGWYYLTEEVGSFEGQMKTGWVNAPDGNMYFLDSTGKMQTGYVVNSKLVCYLNEKHDGTFGALQSKDLGEWKPVGSVWTHMTNGAYDTGWFYSPYSKSWFYLDSVSKIMQVGWKEIDGLWYYLRPEKETTPDGSNLSVGSMMVGISAIDGKTYVFNTQSDMPIGAMRKEGWTIVDGYAVYVNSDGTLAVNKWINKDGKKVYVGSDGLIKQSVVSANKPYNTNNSTGSPSRPGSSGGVGGGGSSSGGSIGGSGSTSNKYKQEVVTDRDGNKVYYDRYGNKVQSGWVTDKNGNNYYIENGYVVTDSVVIDKNGNNIFVDKNGNKVQNGIVTDKNGNSYIIKDGNILTNQEYTDDKGKTHYVDENGVMQKDEFYQGSDGNTHYVDKDGNRVENGVVVDKNGDRYTVTEGVVSKDKIPSNGGGFITDENGNIHYYDKDGNKVENGFVTTPDGDKIYIENGDIITNQVVDGEADENGNKDQYYAGADGKFVYDKVIQLPNGLYIYVDKDGHVHYNYVIVDKDGNKYGLIDGKFVINDMAYIGKDTYYFGEDGKMVFSTVVPSGNKDEFVFAGEDGKIVTTDGIYTDKSGNNVIVINKIVVVNKWITVGDKEYHVNENGFVDKDKFITNSDGTVSYVDGNGNKVINGVIIDSNGNKHVFENGIMVTDKWVDLGDGKEPVYVDKDGNIVTNDVVTVVNPETGEEEKVYVDDEGHIITGDGTVTTPDGNEIIIEDGKVVVSDKRPDENGNDYFYDENGNKVTDGGVHIDKDGNEVITGGNGEISKDEWVEKPDGSGDVVHTNPDGTVDKDEWVDAPDGSGDKVHVGEDGTMDKDKWVPDENGEDIYVGEDGKPSKDEWVDAPDGSGDKVHVGENGKPSKDEWVAAPDGSGDKVHVDEDGKIDTDKWLENENGDKVHVDENGNIDKDKWVTDENGDKVHVGADGTIDKDKWVTDEDGDKYVDENGQIKKDEWITDENGNKVHVGSDGNVDKNTWLEDEDGHKIKVDENGNIVTDKIVTDDNGNDVYVDDKGHVKEDGVITDESGKHIIENGIIVKDKWTTDESGNKVHVNEDGVVDTNTVVDGEDGNKHYVGEDGTIVKDQIIELPDGSIIVIDKDGNVIEGGLYEDGNGNHHYVKDDGTIAKGEIVTAPNGDKYYADENGNIIKDQWVDDHYYGKDGVMVTDSKLKDENGNDVWVDENGEIIKGGYVTNEDGSQSWVDENGHVVENGFVNNGNSYIENGVIVKDRIVPAAVSGYYHYFDLEGLLKKDATVETHGDKYPIDTDGYIIPDAIVVNKDGSFITSNDGSIYVGPAIVNIGGYDYYVGIDGKVIKDAFFEDDNGKHYVDSDGKLLKNDLVSSTEGVYVFDENGNLVSKDTITLDNGDTYYANDAGLTVKGLCVVTDKNDNLLIVDENGKVVKATDYSGDGFVYYDFVTINPDKYIVDKSGYVVTETVLTDLNQDKWFTSATGKLVIGQFVTDADGNRYLTGSDGRVVINKWIDDENGDHVYVGGSGVIGSPHNHVGGEFEQLSEARCAVDGLRVNYCRECGGIVDKEIIPATGHTPEWRTISAPSCTENGQQSNVCTKCGEIVGYQTLNYLGHDWDEGEVTPATCRAQGYTTYRCQRDGCVILRTDDYTPLVDHTNSGYQVTTPPTCVSVGYEKDMCSECGTILDTRTVDPLGHIWDMGYTIDATCTTGGYQEHTCIRCSEKMRDGDTEPLGHNMSDFDVLSESTCTSAGFDQSVCIICGYTVYEKHDALGHDVEEDFDYEFLPGYAVKRCETCEALMEREANTYYVDYHPNSGIGDMDVDTFTYNNGKELKANAFNRAFAVELDATGGYIANSDVDVVSEFTGWALEEGGGKVYSDRELVSTLTTVPNETVTLYASWRDVADLPKPVKVGYHFNAWKDANGNIVTGQITCNNGESVVLYADWIPNNDTEYVVKHYKQTLTNTWDLVATDELWGTTNTPVSPSTYVYSGFKTPTPQTVIINPDGTTVIEYYYERETYTLYIDKGDGISVVNGAGDYKFGETVNVSAVVSDSTYKWGGWTGNFTPSNSQEASFKMPAYNVTLMANAKGNSYTVEYDNSDCKGRIEPSIFPFDEYRTLSDGSGFKKSFSVNFQSQSDLVYETQKIDLGFIGWTKTQGSSVVDFSGGQSVQNIAEYGVLTLYPVWEKRTINLPTPTKANHIFLGWSTNGNTSGLINAGSYTPTDDVTLVGLWRKAEYTVRFDGNGANGGSVANQKCTSGDNCRLNSNTFTKYYTVTLDANGGNCSTSSLNANLAFNGWSESPNGAVVYANNGNINKELSDGSEIHIYANWGSGSVNLPAATRTGYTFLGWSESPVAQTGSTGTLSGITSNKRLYAIWSPNSVIVSYNANGGTGTMNPSTFKYGVAQSLTPNAFTKTYKVSLNANGGTCSTAEVSGNADFLGWATSTGGLVVYSNSQYMSVTGNITLYARWGRVDIALPTPTREGYIFKGWSTSSSATSGIFDKYACEGNVVLYATWEKSSSSGDSGGSETPGFDTSGIPNFTTAPANTVYLVNGEEIKRIASALIASNADEYSKAWDTEGIDRVGATHISSVKPIFYTIDSLDSYTYCTADVNKWENNDYTSAIFVQYIELLDFINSNNARNCSIRIAGKCEGTCDVRFSGEFDGNIRRAYAVDSNGKYHYYGSLLKQSFSVRDKENDTIFCNKDSAFLFSGYKYLMSRFNIFNTDFVVDASGMYMSSFLSNTDLYKVSNNLSNVVFANYMFANNQITDVDNLASVNLSNLETAVGMFQDCTNLSSFQGLMYMPKCKNITNINCGTNASVFPSYVFGNLSTFSDKSPVTSINNMNLLKGANPIVYRIGIRATVTNKGMIECYTPQLYN